MTKNKFNAKLREYARTLSPRKWEQVLVSKVYDSFNDLLGKNNCIQIGSYPRYTAITPIHDLDLLYSLGSWNEQDHDPLSALNSLYGILVEEYENPTEFEIDVSLQEHSVTVAFSNEGGIVFCVDIVPAYSFDNNEFGQDKYKVPEVLNVENHSKRRKMEWDSTEGNAWIDSDPKGYIKVATLVGNNSDFRKTVKFVKKWKDNLKKSKTELKLKSFHLEQVITSKFQQNPELEIFDVIFDFFFGLPEIVDLPNQIVDRADPEKYIDNYLANFTVRQKEKIGQARDGFLVKLEKFDESDSIDSLLEIDFYERGVSEEFIFDKNIPTISEEFLTINAWIQKDGKNFRRLGNTGHIDNGLDIRFEVFMPIAADHYKWKVKNDDECSEPRGEISDHRTKNDPELTKYKGDHYVECYAIRGNICVASARQNVILLK